jgi:hypothetical protein
MIAVPKSSVKISISSWMNDFAWISLAQRGNVTLEATIGTINISKKDNIAPPQSYAKVFSFCRISHMIGESSSLVTGTIE